jgi:hypothetical protein
MAAKSFLRLVAGRFTEILGITTSAGAADDGKIPALDATGKLDISFLPIGIGADVKILPTSENLTAGNWVNVYDLTGTLTARKADATAAGKEAVGYVLAGTTSPSNATVYFDGINNALSGLTAGEDYFLATTAGTGVATTPPTGAGKVVQRLGQAISTTEIEADLDSRGVVLAA